MQALALEGYVDDLSPSSDNKSHGDHDGDATAAPGARQPASLSEADLAPLKQAVAEFRTAAEAVGSWAGTSSRSAGLADVPVEAMAKARAMELRGAALSRPTVGGEGLGRATATRVSVADLNERLGLTERRFLAQEGLPGRPWFRHVLQAPGLYLG